MNLTILFKEHMMFWTSPLIYVLTPKRDIGAKLPSYNSGSAGWLSW